MKAMSPLISVVLPVYNAEKYLTQSIESVLTQTYQNFELLLIDDGSTDKSKEIMYSYHDDRIKILLNKYNRGLVYSLNKGIKYAQGKYIARMDADDICLPQRFQYQVKYMEGHPEVDVCGTCIEAFSAQGSWVISYPQDDKQIKSKMFFGCAFAHPTVMMRRKTLLDNAYRYSDDFLYAEDYDLWCRMMKRCKFYNIPRVLLKYRVGTTTKISDVHSERQKRLTEEIIKRNISDLLNTSENIEIFFSKKKITYQELLLGVNFIKEVVYCLNINGKSCLANEFKNFLFMFLKKNQYLGWHIWKCVPIMWWPFKVFCVLKNRIVRLVNFRFKWLTW